MIVKGSELDMCVEVGPESSAEFEIGVPDPSIGVTDTVITTTMRDGTKYIDVFDDNSQNSGGGWPKDDLKSSCPA